MNVRSARPGDVDNLLEIEEMCWVPHLRTSREVIMGRIRNYPEGQYVLDHGGKAFGILYSQRIKSLESLLQGKYQTQTSLHDPRGNVIQLLAIAVNFRAMPGNTASFLRDGVIQSAGADATVSHVVAMTRCSRFLQLTNNSSFQKDYHELIWSAKDPTIFFHVSGGAEILQVVENYRPEDVENLGNAVCISYPLGGREPLRASRASTLAHEICDQLVAWVGAADPSFFMDAPLMGSLDSFHMLSLHNWLEQRFSLSLPPAYLFTACTPRKIQEDFITRLSDTRPPPPPPPPPRSDPSPPPQDSQAVAIVGIACKLPGGIDSVDEFWRVLLRKECKASKVPFERWDVDSLDMAELVSDPDKRRSVQYGCFVDDAEAFDASFFGINKDETRNMDPNQRLLLEIITKALYDSGKTKQEIAGSNTGVWIGMSNSDYQDVPGAGFRESKSVYGATGGAASVAAGRVSYCLGLEGPSLVVDTACSSSLVALHQAATSLRLGECSAAVVAGVNLMLTPWISVAYARAGMTSADGKCHTFDEAANGYCRGEGCAAVVLKRVSDLQEGECVYAILRGSAVVQDGQSASLTAPNGGAQEKLLRAALADAKLLPQSVRYIEAHGTGTKLGDPIEVSAIASVYGDRSDHNPLFVSSSKANIGHLEAAAGMAGLIAAVLVVGHSTAPPNCHLTKLNTMIKKTLQGAPIHFPRTAMNLKGGVGEGLIAGVSSFGYSGTIAHALIEEPPAHSRRVLAPILPAEFSNPTVWQFSGQGTLAINVGRNLYFCSVAFRSAMDRCDAAAEPLLGIPISSILYPRAEVERQAVELLLDTCFAQPALVALEYCLAQEWISRGHWPSLVLGHSLGEYAAAVVAGVMSIESCLKLVCARAECVKNADFADGVMVALRATRAQVEGAIVAANATEEAAVAAVNKARSVVLSGSIEGVQRTLEVLGESAMICKLDVEYAFHSPLMLPVQSAYRSVLEATSLFAPQIPLISTVRGHEAVEGDVCGTQYWLDHLVDPVLYETAVQRALALGKMAFLEIGADSTLSRLTRSIDPGVAVASSAEYLCRQEGAARFEEAYLRCSVAYKPPTHRVLTHRTQSWNSETETLHGSICSDVDAHRAAFALRIGGDLHLPSGAVIDLLLSSSLLQGQAGSGQVAIADVLIEGGQMGAAKCSVGCSIQGSTASVIFDNKTLAACSFVPSKSPSPPPPPPLPASSDSSDVFTLEREGIYQLLGQRQCHYDAALRVLQSVQLSAHDIQSSICPVIPRTQEGYGYSVHPAVLEGMVQTATVHAMFANRDVRAMVERCDEIVLHTASPLLEDYLTELSCVAQLRADNAYNVQLISSGRAVVCMRGLVLARGRAERLVKLTSEWGQANTNRKVDIPKGTLCIVGRKSDLKAMRRFVAAAGELFSFVAVDFVCADQGMKLAKRYDLAIVCQFYGSDCMCGDRFMPEWMALIEAVCDGVGRVLVLRRSVVGTSGPELFPVLGGCLMSVQREYPTVRMKVVDCDAASALDESLLEALGGELFAWDDELEIQYREGRRLINRYRECSAVPATLQMEGEGAWVVTGGLGALGLKSAITLVGRGARAIVLLSRAGRVSREGQGLEQDLEWLQCESGAQVLVLQCDVSEEEQVVKMLSQARETFGSITGIVHAAGVIRDGLIRGGSALTGSADVWSSKARSAWLLHKHTLQDNIEVFVLFSSIFSAIGNIGQSTYSAANRFLDDLAVQRRDLGLPGVSIRWPAVSDVGMAVAVVQGGLPSINSVQAMELLMEVVDGCLPGPVVTLLPPGMLDTLEGPCVSQFRHLMSQPTPGTSATSATGPPSQGAGVVWSHPMILDTIRGVVAAFVDVDGSGGEPLMKLGLDSLGVTELTVQLSKSFGMRVSAALIFSYPSLNDLVSYFAQELLSARVEEKTEKTEKTPQGGDVAIVGMACRLPGDVSSLSALWEVVSQGRDVTGEAPYARWDTDKICTEHDPEIADRIRYGGFLSSAVLSSFDHGGFGISLAEAQRMDPAQKLLLTVAYEALVDAGYSRETLQSSNVGVFVAASGSLDDRSRPCKGGGAPSVFDATGKALSIAAGRISFTLGLDGPCSTIDTACSSSLVAIHQARRSLQLGECSVAVVAGVGILTPDFALTLATAGMTSPDGKCHTFDKSANGYCRAEGCAAIVLQCVAEASAVGTKMYAVVRGSAVQQDGKSASLTAPNGLAQQRLIASALRDAKMDPKRVNCVEAHGTGTRLGDPVEVQALAKVFGVGGTRGPLYVSGVKAVMGHLEAAAGMAGLLSVVLSLLHGQAPPNAQLKELNPEVAATVQGTLIQFPTRATPLCRSGEDRFVAGLSSFGYSGTIAHMIFEEPADALKRTAQEIRPQESESIVWQFSGQGTLQLNSCRELYDSDSAFGEAMQRCDAILLRHIRYSASELLYPGEGGAVEAAAAGAVLMQTQYAQPVHVALQYCIASVMISRGIVPETVIGHSLGEYAAAVIAGVMSIEDCLKAVCERGRIVHESASAQGVMVAVRSTAEEVNEAIAQAGAQDHVSVAAVNGKKSVVVSGADKLVSCVLELLASGSSGHKLRVEHAFHSPLMKCVAQEYKASMQAVALQQPKIRFVSTVGDGELDVSDSQYWLEHLVLPVQYQRAVEEALQSTGSVFVEIGPDSVLTKMGRSLGQMDERPSARWQHGVTDLLRASAQHGAAENQHRMLQQHVREEFSCVDVFKGTVHGGIMRDWAEDYRVDGQVRFPHVALLEMAYAAAKMCAGPGDVRLTNFDITCPLVVDSVGLQCVVDDAGSLTLYSGSTLHAEGSVCLVGKADAAADWDSIRRNSAETASTCDKMGDSDLYAALSLAGRECGPKFRLVRECRSSKHACTAVLAMPDASLRDRYLLPPPLLEGMLQSAYVVLSHWLSPEVSAALEAVSFESVWVQPSALEELWGAAECACTVQLQHLDHSGAVLDCTLLTHRGTVVAHLQGVHMAPGGGSGLSADDSYVLRGMSPPEEGAVLILGRSPEAQCVNRLLDRDAVVVELSEYSSFDADDEEVIQSAIICLPDGSIDQCDPAGGLLRLLERLCRTASRIVVLMHHPDLSGACPGLQESVSAVLLTAQAEYPSVDITSVTLDPAKAWREAVEDALATEICARGEVEVSYSCGQRLVKRYEHAPANRVAPTTHDGAVLITGGLGGLGLKTAKTLVGLGVKKIALVSRTGAVHLTGQGLEQDLEWLQCESGAQVLVLQCDVSEEEQVVKMLSQARETFGSITGIVHAAGVIRDGLIRSGWASAGSADVWSSKASSAWLLHKHTLQDKIGMFVLFSSIASAIGNIGQSNYSAANRFLDDLAVQRRKQGLPGVSIQWPAVSDVGMAVTVLQGGRQPKSWSIDGAQFCSILGAVVSSIDSPAVVCIMPPAVFEGMSAKVRRQFQSVLAPEVLPPTIVGAGSDQKVESVESAIESVIAPVAPVESNSIKGLVWQFSGQGTLQLNSCRELYDSDSAFGEAMQRCDAILLRHIRYSASELLYPGEGGAVEAAAAGAVLMQTQYAQPVHVVLQYCIASVMISRGIVPETVIGHSLGEYAAAVIAGVMSIEDCLNAVCERGRIVHESASAQGVMVAVRSTAEEVNEAIAQAGAQDHVSVAAVNGKKSVVVSGADKSVSCVLELLASGSSGHKLRVEHAFHSPLMKCVAQEYKASMQAVALQQPKIRFVSTVGDGELDVSDSQYWLEHLVLPVQYQRAVEEALQSTGSVFVEIGPDSVLSRLGKSIVYAMEAIEVPSYFVSSLDVCSGSV